ncbi:cholesterol 24-hydroxylase-like [Asterias rubens]|uniref:cholesterol 24-hydroxylase-like n=1 Tax=Asterias rubens TaxID=7604 RepID=UPI0014555757|nr:cholesterol 24-hydroxylase-like [Asterias rubens]
MATELCNTPVACLLVYSCLLLVSLLGCLFLVAVMYIHYQHRRFAHIPSPKMDGFFVGHAVRFQEYKKRDQPIVEVLLDMANECGPVYVMFIFWLHSVTVLHPDGVKELLSFDSPHRKPSRTYSAFKEVFGARFLGGGLISQRDPIKHGKRRAMFTPMFKQKYLVTLVDQFNASADLLIEKLSHKADGKTEIAMLDELDRTTLDVIGKVAFGMDLNSTLDENAPFNKAVGRSLDGLSENLYSPLEKYNMLPAARKSHQEVRDAINFLRETGRRCIEGKLQKLRNNEELHDDIFTHILRETYQNGAEEIEMEDLVDEFVTLFFAGQETTSNLLGFCLLELGNHPEVMHRVRTEVDAVMGDNDQLKSSDVGKLGYMMQVLKETLRLWSPVSGTLRELAHDIEVKGYKIPKGAVVGVTSHMAKMEEYFPDPMKFDPDRFMAGANIMEYTYFPFSSGTRSCIGKQFALIEARVLLARLLHKFTFDLVPGQGYGILDQVTLKPKGRCRNYLSLVE